MLRGQENGNDIAVLPVRRGKGAIERKKTEDRRCRGPVPVNGRTENRPEGLVKDYPKEAFVSTIIAARLRKEIPWDDCGHRKISVSDITAAGWGTGHLLRAFQPKEASGKEAGNF